MAEVLDRLYPERVWFYFESICAIPHGSGHTAKIANYLTFFAKMHGLSCVRDKANNVIIRKDASPGCSRAEGVISTWSARKNRARIMILKKTG